MWHMLGFCKAHARARKHRAQNTHPPRWWWRCLLTGGACSRKYKLTQHKQAPAGLALQHGALGALRQELALLAPCSIQPGAGVGRDMGGGVKGHRPCVHAVHLRPHVVTAGQAADTGPDSLAGLSI